MEPITTGAAAGYAIYAGKWTLTVLVSIALNGYDFYFPVYEQSGAHSFAQKSYDSREECEKRAREIKRATQKTRVYCSNLSIAQEIEAK